MILRITHNAKFSGHLHINDEFIDDFKNKYDSSFNIPETQCNVKIYTYPYNIKPYLRIDGVLINYGLAKVTPWDHMLEFEYSPLFYDRYQLETIRSKEMHFQRKADDDISKIIENHVGGVSNNANKTVAEIKNILSQ
ncbi:MAG: hypothetical protein HOD28_01925 [Candidatus Marinimicrobia bacterium]|jgi:hypothetical protein|nr:hypothetical protein [Candidatus Neomarinimicrobiota bacterium]